MRPETGLTETDLARLLGRTPAVKWDRLLADAEPEPEPEPVEPPESAPLAERLA